MLLAVTGSMLVARRIESRSIYTLRFHLGRQQEKPDVPAQLPHFERLMSRDFPAISAAAGFGDVAEKLLSSSVKPPLYVLDYEGKLVGTIDVGSLRAANLGAMPIEAAKASDMVRAVQPLNSQMSEHEVLERLAGASEHDLPVIDAGTARMIGVIFNKKPDGGRTLE